MHGFMTLHATCTAGEGEATPREATFLASAVCFHQDGPYRMRHAVTFDVRAGSHTQARALAMARLALVHDAGEPVSFTLQVRRRAPASACAMGEPHT